MDVEVQLAAVTSFSFVAGVSDVWTVPGGGNTFTIQEIP